MDGWKNKNAMIQQTKMAFNNQPESVEQLQVSYIQSDKWKKFRKTVISGLNIGYSLILYCQSYGIVHVQKLEVFIGW